MLHPPRLTDDKTSAKQESVARVSAVLQSDQSVWADALYNGNADEGES